MDMEDDDDDGKIPGPSTPPEIAFDKLKPKEIERLRETMLLLIRDNVPNDIIEEFMVSHLSYRDVVIFSHINTKFRKAADRINAKSAWLFRRYGSQVSGLRATATYIQRSNQMGNPGRIQFMYITPNIRYTFDGIVKFGTQNIVIDAESRSVSFGVNASDIYEIKMDEERDIAVWDTIEGKEEAEKEFNKKVKKRVKVIIDQLVTNVAPNFVEGGIYLEDKIDRIRYKETAGMGKLGEDHVEFPMKMVIFFIDFFHMVDWHSFFMMALERFNMSWVALPEGLDSVTLSDATYVPIRKKIQEKMKI